MGSTMKMKEAARSASAEVEIQSADKVTALRLSFCFEVVETRL